MTGHHYNYYFLIYIMCDNLALRQLIIIKLWLISSDYEEYMFYKNLIIWNYMIMVFITKTKDETHTLNDRKVIKLQDILFYFSIIFVKY